MDNESRDHSDGRRFSGVLREMNVLKLSPAPGAHPLHSDSPSPPPDEAEQKCACRPPRRNWRRDVPIALIINGFLAFLLEIIGLTSPFSQHILSPGFVAGFFFILVAALAIMRYVHELQSLSVLTIAANGLAAIVAVICLTMTAISFKRFNAVDKVRPDSAFPVTRVFIILTCLIGFALSLFLSIKTFLTDDLSESSESSEGDSEAIEMPTLPMRGQMPSTSSDKLILQNEALAPAVSPFDISGFDFIDQNEGPSSTSTGTGRVSESVYV